MSCVGPGDNPNFRVPPASSDAYLWWSQGAADEHAAHDEGLQASDREVRDVLEGLARARRDEQFGPQRAAWLVRCLARIYVPDELRRRYR